MPNLRRSIQSKNNGGLSPTRTYASANTVPAPRKVIKALYDYNPQQGEELSFAKGDFFHVVSNEDDPDWYEACNPITGARGYVPVSYFQTLEKPGGQQQARQRNSSQSFEDSGNDSGAFTDPLPHQYYPQQPHAPQQHYHQQHIQHSQSFSSSGGPAPSAAAAAGAPSSSASSPAMSQKSLTSPLLPRCQPLYGIVLYDFGAERADELDCKVGEAILVIAQSNEEWYVAKPIGRLGGPGLIPVSFVEIRDLSTGKVINVPEMLRQTGTMIPRVDEWKKQAMEYKANSIPLGRIDTNDGPQQPQPQQQPTLYSQPQQQPTVYSQPLQYHSQPPQTMPFQSQPIHLQQQSGGPSIQQLKNKLSRGDLKAPNLRDQTSRRNPSQDLDIGRRMEGSNGRMPPIAARSYAHDAHDHHNSSPSARIAFASVESFHHEDGQYWFSVRVELASGAVRNLFRLYEDFYNFHIALLEEFPSESGRMGDQPRILPFMPIPLPTVTDEVSASRRTDLDA
ncbi:bud emergence protein 1, partial [Dissophora ornata]